MSKVLAICPHCKKKYRVQIELLGRSTNCKQCQNSFEIIATDEDTQEFGIPDANDYMANQAFDPLAPVAQSSGQDPAQTYDVPGREPVPQQAVELRDWKSEVKQNRKQSPFGTLQKLLLATGVIFIITSVIFNLLPLFGIPIGPGNLGRFLGLAIGLFGAGALAGSLFKFPASARLAGATAALLVFLVFVASISKARQQTQPPGKPVVQEPASTLASFDSPWIENFPGWIGFDEMEKLPSLSDRWNRQQIEGTQFSASFPGQPTFEKGRIQVARKNVPTKSLVSQHKGFEFTLTVFKFPSTRSQTDQFKLNETEQAIGDIKLAKQFSFDRRPGKEYRITDSPRTTHGRIFLVDDTIVHIQTVGLATMVPGVLSLEFLDSLQLRANGGGANETIPEFELNPEQTSRQSAMVENARQIKELVANHLKSGGLMNFPNRYISISAGRDEGSRQFLVHPGKLPIIGVDLIEIRTNRGSMIGHMTPIFDQATDDQSIMARDGYALAGLEVNAGKWIKGVRLVFMQITPEGFDVSKSYRSKWYGTRSSGPAEKLAGDGDPVYGFWFCRNTILKSIGLIRERK